MPLPQTRTIMLWLLMLLLPTQALANALLPLCLASQAHEQSLDRADHAAAHAAGHGMHSGHDADDAPPALHLDCPLCAGSCHATGALTSPSELGVSLSPAAPAALLYSYFAGHVGDTPRRPPRNHLL
ncbi:hypothetical protein ACFSB1_02585 [Halopseudomonas phragmitis]|uniref:hypothetical protein n=2 Tax=Pseudomonadaceae TaxID=135621 RepID=UPI0012BA9531|nr:hypothetical protein [Halopseudomonas phragmitis]